MSDIEQLVDNIAATTQRLEQLIQQREPQRDTSYQQQLTRLQHQVKELHQQKAEVKARIDELLVKLKQLQQN